MDRQIIYPGQIAVETDLLNTNRNTMISIGKLAGALFGTAGITNGLTVGPSSPLALTVDVAPGEIYQTENVDNTAYSSLPADTTDAILKQGIMLAKQTLACAAPGTAGFSINYLIQATYQDSDTGAVALPYYNASNPSQAYSGPNNTGATQATRRSGIVVLSAKAGTAATTGTQTTPAPDTGYIALASVTVANGQSTIVAGNIIAIAPASPPMVDTAAIYSDLASTATGKGAALAGYQAPWTGSVARTAAQEFGDVVKVVQGAGCDPTGATDSLAAFQSALNYLATLPNGGQLIVPAGTFKLSAALTYSGQALRITGAGMNATVLKWSNATSGIQITCTASTSFPDISTEPVVEHLTMVALAAASGDGLKVTYAHVLGVEAYFRMSNVAIINGPSGYWTNALHTQNLSDAILENVYLFCPGTNTTNCLFIDNSLTIANYGLSINKCSINGGINGIKCTGWLESLYISDTAIVGCTACATLDATGTTNGNTNLQVVNCHFNCKQYSITTTLWRSIFIANSDIYSGVGTGDVIGTNLQISSATNVMVTGSKFEAGNTSVARTGIGITNGTNITITGCLILMNASGIVFTGSTGQSINVTGNIIKSNSGTATGTGVYQGQTTGDAVISDNLVEAFATGINILGPNAQVHGNRVQGATTVGITSSAIAVDARGNLMSGNATNYSGTLRRDFVVTQSLTPGAVSAGASSATGITIAGAAFGDTIQVAAPAGLSNLLAGAWVNGSGTGVLNFYNLTGSSQTPPSGTYTFLISN